MQKDNIARINDEINKLVSSNGKEANPSKLTDEEKEQAMAEIFKKAHELFMQRGLFSLLQK